MRGVQRAHLECPESFTTGETSVISSASVWSVKSCGTSQMQTLPSSEPEATIRSLKGFLQPSQRPSLPLSQPAMGESVPVGVEDGGGMAAEQRDLVGELAPLFKGNDGEGAAARSVPIDRQVFGVDLLSSVNTTTNTTTRHGIISRSRRTLTRLVSQALRLIRRLS